MFDIIIIGAGVSGMTSALYSLRAGKSVLLLEHEAVGGQIASSPRVENYPSIKEISGLDLANNMFEQVMDMGAEFEFEDVKGINKVADTFVVTTDYNTYESKAVIIANGVKHRKFNLPKEEQLIGHGISYCAVCDGAFYKDEEVALIGDANTALQYAILLSNYCKKVHLCTLFDKFFGEDILVSRVKERENIIIKHNLSLQEYIGEDELTGLRFKDTQTNEDYFLNCKAVFVAIGQIPDNEKYGSLVELQKGYIVTNEKMETKTPGLYASGDTRVKAVRQVTTATADGAIASVMACSYIDSLGK